MGYWISGNNPSIPMIRLEGSALLTPLFVTHTRFELCTAKCASATPFVYRCYALFHFPYPVSLLFATHTKTAGCIPTLPVLKLRASLRQTPPPLFSGRNFLTPFLPHSSALFCKNTGGGVPLVLRIACWSHESPVVSSGFPSFHPLESPHYTTDRTHRNEARA
jgi:hypothetical protein